MNKNFFRMFPEFQTNRLLFREIKSLDISAVFEIYSNEAVAKYEWFRPFISIDQALKLIANMKMEFKEGIEINWGVIRKEDNKLIGTCNLGDFDFSSRRCGIGYTINKNEWNKGYGTEIVKALVEYGFKKMNVNRIEAFVTPGNNASVRVLKKAYFVEEGLLRERDLIKDKLEDAIILAILKSDYDDENVLKD